MEETKEIRLDEISIWCILWDVVRNAWVVVLAVVAAYLGIAGVLGLLYEPVYTSSATLAVTARGNSGGAYSSLNITTQMADVFTEVFQSDVLREQIALDMGRDSVSGEITASVISETNLVTLQVTSVTPQDAYEMIQSALRNYEGVSDYLFSNARLQIVQSPQIPYGPSNVQNIRRYQRLGMLGAGALVVACIALFNIMRFTVKTRKSAERNLDGRILGEIPFEQKYHSWKEALHRSKQALLIQSPAVSMQFAEALRRASARIEQHMRRRGQKVLIVTSIGENEVKSSVAANLAIALAEKGRRVLLVDGDLKKPAQYRVFDQQDAKLIQLSEWLESGKTFKGLLHFEKKSGIFCIFQKTSVRASGRLLKSDKMKSLMEACREQVDFIVIDTPPLAEVSDGELLLAYGDCALVVTRQDWVDVRILNDTADTVRQSQSEFLGFLLNAFHRDRLSALSRYGNYRHYRGSQEVPDGR